MILFPWVCYGFHYNCIIIIIIIIIFYLILEGLTTSECALGNSASLWLLDMEFIYCVHLSVIISNNTPKVSYVSSDGVGMDWLSLIMQRDALPIANRYSKDAGC